MKSSGLILGIIACFAPSLAAEAGTVHPLHENWRLQSACVAKADGAAISSPAFGVDDWLKTSVPSTVLAAQAADQVIPDPYYGMNLRNIPGTGYPIGRNFSELPMPQDSPYRCGWWYRTEFSAPPVAERDQRFWLHFGGINYRGNLWLNGRQIADSTAIAGAYRTYDFDVTDVLKPGAQNVLAVRPLRPQKKTLASTGSIGIRVLPTKTWASGAKSIS